MPKVKQNQKTITEITKNVSIFVEKLKASEKDYKADLDKIRVENVGEVSMEEGKVSYLIQLSSTDEKSLRKVHTLLVKKLEEHLNSPVVIIPSKKRINGKDYARYVSAKVPRDRTLTAVFDSYLDDLLYPATIIGKRIRYPKGPTRQFKVIIDPLDKNQVEYKIPAITACYKALTNRDLEVIA